MRTALAFLLSLVVLCACGQGQGGVNAHAGEPAPIVDALPAAEPFDTTATVIHVLVALCDNRYQGIVPVPKAIGNGQDPDNNLYWGCGYGVRTFFKKSADWKLVGSSKPDTVLMERLVFRHAMRNAYLVADAYNGKYIARCIHHFLGSACGDRKETLAADGRTLGIAGNARLVAYCGHDGLMDFDLRSTYANSDGRRRDVIVLACYSRRFFTPYLKDAEVTPLVWTTNLMCPEAYTLHDALAGYLAGESAEGVRSRAAAAYDRYQKCGLKAARGLLVTGW